MYQSPPHYSELSNRCNLLSMRARRAWHKLFAVALLATLPASLGTVAVVRGEAMATVSVERTGEVTTPPTPTPPAPVTLPTRLESPPSRTLVTPPVTRTVVPPPNVPTILTPATPTLVPAMAPAEPKLTTGAAPVIPGAESAAALPVAGSSKPVDPAATQTGVSPLETMPIRSAPAPEIKGTTTQPPPIAGARLSGFYAAAQVGGALAVVLGLIYGGRAILRRFVPGAVAGNGRGVIEILARYPLCKNQSLVLLRLGSQLVLLSQGKETSQSVLVVSDPQEVAAIMGQVQGARPDSIQAGFSRLLDGAREDLERDASVSKIDDAPESYERPADSGTRLAANRALAVEENLDGELDEMAAARRQLMDLRQQVRNVRERLPS
jgi:flagellar biogenesis protein FliO